MKTCTGSFSAIPSWANSTARKCGSGLYCEHEKSFVVAAAVKLYGLSENGCSRRRFDSLYFRRYAFHSKYSREIASTLFAGRPHEEHSVQFVNDDSGPPARIVCDTGSASPLHSG